MIGVHNVMTANKPYKWYHYLMVPFSRCQYKSKTIEDLYNIGVRCFDIRVRYNGGNPKIFANWIFSHGLCDFSGSLTSVLFQLNKKEDTVVRLFIDGYKWERYQEEFKQLYEECKNDFPRIKFFHADQELGGRVNVEETYIPILKQYVGSMMDDARWYEKIIPWFYAKRKNKDNLQKAIEEDTIYLYDYL